MSPTLRARAALSVFLAGVVPSVSAEAADRKPFSFEKSGRLASGRTFSLTVRESAYRRRPGEPEDDGSRWGIDGGFPRTYCTAFEVVLDGTRIPIERKLYNDLSYLRTLDVTESGADVAIRVEGSDGAGSFHATFTFREFEIEREVRHREFPDSVWERTVVHRSVERDVE